jgi:hypothetical protein
MSVFRSTERAANLSSRFVADLFARFQAQLLADCCPLEKGNAFDFACLWAGLANVAGEDGAQMEGVVSKNRHGAWAGSLSRAGRGGPPATPA